VALCREAVAHAAVDRPLPSASAPSLTLSDFDAALQRVRPLFRLLFSSVRGP
jgi:hypothetical protein